MRQFHGIPIILTLYAFVIQPAFSQSLAFRALLNKTYDSDFPLVYPEQRELFEKAVVLDTREKEEYAVSNLKGSRWVGYDTFSMASVADIAKEDTVIVYCSIGARSQDIGKKLKDAGFQHVYNLYGGIFHWVNEHHPVFTPDDNETIKVHTYNRVWGMWLKRGEKVY
nr:rhodanese-like domain-containing protein [Cytophagales bacterium]